MSLERRLKQGILAWAGASLALVGVSCHEAGGGAADPGADGQDHFRMSCANCHGANAQGRGLLGSNLRANEFIRARSDQELADFIREGRPATHPDNLRGIEMPPRGGNASLTDEQIDLIVAYLRSLQ